jgi:molybdate transport system ATP-binding protein
VAPEEAAVSVVLEAVSAPLGPFALTVDLVAAARVTAVFGASGAGKTSLLEIVAGLRRPATGRVVLNGRVLDDTAAGVHIPSRLRGVGYVPQDDTLFPHLSVAANLGYARAVSLAAATRVADVLELGPLLSRRPAGLSGGERRRVALGRALLSSPEVLLLDEPLTGLDAPLKERVLSYFVRIRDEFAIPTLYVSHAPEEVLALADEVVVLERGCVVTRGRPVDVFVPSSAPAWQAFAHRTDAFP